MAKNAVFRQVLQFLPRSDFEKIEKRHYHGRQRQMNAWTQCLSLILSQLLCCLSLRDIADTLNAYPEKYYHHGMHRVSKSSLCRAMGDFSCQIYEELFQFLLARCRRSAPGHSFKFKNKLYLIDSTIITLCYSLFNWASYKQGKGGVKIHTKLDACGQLPVFITISAAKSHDSQAARLMQLKKDDIVAFDRGYRFKWFKVLGPIPTGCPPNRPIAIEQLCLEIRWLFVGQHCLPYILYKITDAINSTGFSSRL